MKRGVFLLRRSSELFWDTYNGKETQDLQFWFCFITNKVWKLYKRFVLMHLPGKITYKVRFHQTRGCLHRFGLWLGGRVQSLIALCRALTFSLNISVSEHLCPAGDRRDDPNGGQEWGREDQLFRVQGDNIIYKYHLLFWQQHLQISYHISNLNLALSCHVRIWGIQFAKSCQRS